MEWDCGDWSGEMYAEIPNKWPKEWEELERDRYYFRPPNGENYPDMLERSKPFVHELLESDQSDIAIVSHGMIGKVMFSYLMGYEPAQILSIHQHNDMVFRVRVEGESRTIAHYTAGDGPYPTFLCPPRFLFNATRKAHRPSCHSQSSAGDTAH